MGKTTRAQTLIVERGGSYYTIDDLDTLVTAQDEPEEFFATASERGIYKLA